MNEIAPADYDNFEHFVSRHDDKKDKNPKGAGRPKGSKNKRTEEMRKYLRYKGVLPVDVLAGMYNADPQIIATAKKFADAAGVSITDAFKLMKQSAEALMPYTEQKLPTQVDVETVHQLPLLQLFNQPPPVTNGTASSRPFEIIDGKISVSKGDSE